MPRCLGGMPGDVASFAGPPSSSMGKPAPLDCRRRREPAVELLDYLPAAIRLVPAMSETETLLGELPQAARCRKMA